MVMNTSGKILSKQDALSSTDAISSTDPGDFNGVSALDDIDNLNNTLQSLFMYDLGEHSEYEHIESDGGDSQEENIDGLDLESIEFKEDFMDDIERLDLSVDDMIEETITPSVDDITEDRTTQFNAVETTASFDNMNENTKRLGGPDGYNVMLACVKKSLPFAFLNGATTYASLCVDLLYCHYTAGVFRRCMKESLFLAPQKHSNVNFALDIQRDIDHLDGKKGFRPRAQ
ncbi:Hypothetical predicted protein [Mytilus galloprovincialis]|uniref:Uncharacterized protein n=1 Tax=Mytilus galloprovincialis TaxID=29158 RepID=A0A8B6CCG2_MYTGA|nr:Hypothetical predicted protein [Mytilus galloprovincialis]